ncbi:MAG TPA: hypothetical protein PLB01_18975, partial [Thermoanaerobaculia bacterium]|nr:hypothetical protein [Thermoanaerobaculia bacterium]
MNSGSRRRGARAAFRTGVPPFTLLAALLASSLVLSGGCRKSAEPAGAPRLSRVACRADALFLAETPAYIPDEADAELSGMGIARVYVVAATLGRDGRATPAPPPPAPLKRPIVLVLMGSEDAASALTGRGAEAGAEWARAVARVLADSRSWGRVAGVHVHIWPTPE